MERQEGEVETFIQATLGASSKKEEEKGEWGTTGEDDKCHRLRTSKG